MNKSLYRIVFNKARGLLMVVAENTASQGKTATEGTHTHTESIWVSLHPLRFALLLAMGMVAWQQSFAQVISDPNAPKNQQATVLTTGNGTVLVNIQTPSAAGVSRNTFTQFDVERAGLILNNSRTNAQTQLGGWVPGNPWLATGSARVILNEVTGSNPSTLRGFVEVAGSRAQVIIANPAGISCDGCGFINASRSTLTTGTPVFSGGNLDSYRVQQGTISFLGAGFDDRQSDYTDILARSIQVNAGIWANQLNVVAGNNDINANSGQAAPINGTGAAPSYAIDVAALGGMYAGKITLLGTERGVGVRNAGQIGASAGDVIVTADGRLENAGQLSSSQALQIASQGGVKNSGTMYSQADTQINSVGLIENTGLVAALNNVDIAATGGNGQVSNSGVIAAGLLDSGTLAAHGDLSVSATNRIVSSGQNLAAGNQTLTAGSLDLSSSKTSAQNLTLIATNGDLQAQYAVLTADQKLTLSATQRLTTDSAQLSADQLSLAAHDLSNVGGKIIQTGTRDFNLGLVGSLNNQQGQISTNSHNMALSAQSVNNDSGKIEHAGNGTLQLNATTWAGVYGQTASNGLLLFNASQATLDHGSTVAKLLNIHTDTLLNRSGELIQTGIGDAQISAKTALDNSAGQIISNDDLHIQAGALNNQGGTLQANTDLGIVATSSVDNRILNTVAGKISSGANLNLSANDLNNTQGQITAAGTLTVESVQQINNNQGALAAKQAVNVNAGSIDNRLGKIGSVQAALVVTAQNTLNNNQGRIEAAQDIQLSSRDLSNREGQISGANVALGTQQYALDNSSGVLLAQGTLSVNSGELNNDAGLIQAGDTLNINTHGQAFNNTHSGQKAGVIAQRDATLNTGNFNNTSGFVGSKNQLNVNATTLVNGGTVSSESTIQLTGSSFDNQTGQVQAAGDISVQAQTINNQNSLIRSGQILELTANSVDNSNTQALDKGLEGNSVLLTTNTLNNRSGAIRANDDLTIAGRGSFDNTQGLISSGKTTSIVNAIATPSTRMARMAAPLSKTLTLNNSQGNILAKQSLALDLASYAGGGQLASQGDLSLKLLGDYTHTGQLQASGTTTFETTGTLTNQGLIAASNTVNVRASQIDNTVSGQIVAENTNVSASGTLTNRGLIDGGETHITATTLNNIGTGRIYGDHLAIGVTTLNNDVENNVAPVIAARDRLDIGATSINNREHALIFSAGDIAIGGALDGNWRASGQASVVNNSSATIEALGNLSVNTARLNNSNAHFSSELVQTSGPVSQLYIQPNGNSDKYLVENFVWQNWSRAGLYRWKATRPVNDNGELGLSPVPRVGEQTCTGSGVDEVCTRVPNADYLPADPAWGYFGVAAPAPEPQAPTLTQPVAPLASRASSCELGAGYDATACTRYNNDLTQFNNDTAAYNAAWTGFTSAYANWQTDSDAKYAALDQKIEAYNNGFAGAEIKAWTQFQVNETEYNTQVTNSDPAKLLAGGAMQLNGGDLVNDKSQIIAGGALTGSLGNLNNIEATGQHIVHQEGTSQYTYSNWRGGFKRYHERKWDAAIAYTPADVVDTISLPVSEARGNAAVSGSNVRAAAQTNINVGAIAVGANQATVSTRTGQALSAISQVPSVNGKNKGGVAYVIRTASTNGGRLTVPNNRLFSQNPDPSAHYLIETDPQFANYRQWLSSDYMLKAMSVDPALSQKRMGDGFYEQKLIREQVALLTGRRFLTGYASDEAEFQSLMDNGITYAKAWQLRPGIALSEAQMAQLTSDMVWLVEREVTLADGSVSRVLVPQLYVRVKDGDVQGDGTLLAGNSIDLKISGDLNNSGTIAGRQVVKLDADNIRNLGGRISGNEISLKAKTDLTNLGGLIDAEQSLTATAGRDIQITSTTQSDAKQAGLSSFSRSSIDRVAGLYVKSKDAQGSLTLVAGRDLTLTAAQVVNNSKDGQTTLSAGNNLQLATVTTGEQENNVRNDKNFLKQGHSEEVGSTIHAQGNVTLTAGNDIAIRAADINSQQGALTVVAGNNIDIVSGEQSSNWSEAHSRKTKGFMSSSSSTTRDSQAQTSAQASSLGGKTVDIAAGKDLKLVGSHVVGESDVSLAAKGNITLAAATEPYSEAHFSQSSKSGFSSATSEGIGFSYGKQSQSKDEQIKGTTQSKSGSVVGSNGGNVSLLAGKDVTLQGSELIAGRAKDDQLQQTGHIDIQGQNVNIEASTDTEQHSFKQQSKSSGVTFALVGTPLDTYRNMKAIKQSNASKYKKADHYLKEIGDSAGSVPQVAISFNRSSSNYAKQSDSVTHTGSSIQAAGDVSIVATGNGTKDVLGKATDGQIKLAGSTIAAGGSVALDAARDIVLTTTTDQYNESSQTSSKKSKLSLATPSAGDYSRSLNGGPNSGGVNPFPYDSMRSNGNDSTTALVQTGSTISGDKVQLVSHSGDIKLTGSGIAGKRDVLLQAEQGQIIAQAGLDEQTHSQANSSKQIGNLGGKDGTSTTTGVRSLHDQLNGAEQLQNTLRSQIVSQQGDVTLDAKQNIALSGTDLQAANDLSLIGQNIYLDPGFDTRQSDEKHKYSQFGQTVSMGGLVVQAAKTIEQAIEAKEKGDSRLSNLYATKAGLTAYNAFLGASAPGTAGTALFKISVSTGGATSSSEATAQSLKNQGNTLDAGRNVSLIATGDGSLDADGKPKDGDIIAKGTRISGENVSLVAARDITLTSADDLAHSRSQSKSKNASSGVSFSMFGSQNGFTFDLALGKGQGRDNGDSITHNNTQVKASDTLTLLSGRDTNLLGAEAYGQRLVADVGRNLNIISLQDSDVYFNKLTNSGLNVSVCIPPICYGSVVSIAATYGRDKTDSDFLAVTQQSGLYSGAEGYDIKVAGNTHLTGAVIASTADARKNQLSTGTLTTADLDNHAHYESSSTNISVSIDLGGTAAPGDMGASAAAQAAGANAGTAFASAGADLSKNALGMLQNNVINNVLANAAQAKDGEANSQTRSAISAGTITITDEAGQQALTGKTAAETIASLNRDTASSHSKLDKIFDKKELERQKEISAVTAGIIGEVNTTMNHFAKEADDKKAEGEKKLAAADNDPNLSTEERTQLRLDGNALKADAKQLNDLWAPGSTTRQLVSAAMVALSNNPNGSTSALLKSVAVNYVQELAVTEVKYIADQWLDPVTKKPTLASEAIRTALQSLTACAGAAAQDQSCSSGAKGAAASVILNNVLGGDPESMSAEQKEQRIRLIQALTTGIALASKDENVAVMVNAAKMEVENNYLANWQKADFVKEMTACKGSAWCETGVRGKYLWVSASQDIHMVTGMALGAAIESRDMLNALPEMPKAIAAIMNNPEILKTLPAGYADQIQSTYDNYLIALETAGSAGATAAGVYYVKLANLTVPILAAGTGAVKGVSTVSKATLEALENVSLQSAKTFNSSKIVFNGIELNPLLPPPVAGFEYSPNLVKGAKTENQLYAHWNGYQGEINLANDVANSGQAVVKWGDQIGMQGNDVISVNPKTGDVNLWDNKYRSNPSAIPESPTFAKRETREAARLEAFEAINNSTLPADVKQTALQNLRNGNFTTNTVGSGKAKNSIQMKYCNNKPC